MSRRRLPALLCLGLLLAAAPAAAEDARALLDRSAELERKGQDDEALAAARAGLAAAEQAGDESARGEALRRIAGFLLFRDPAEADRLYREALAIVERRAGPASYEAALVRIQLAMQRALAGDRAGQLDAIIAAAWAMAATATTPAQREESAAALTTAAQFADSAGRRADAERILAAGLAMLGRSDTRQSADAGQAYEIAADLQTRWGRSDEALTMANRAIAVWTADATNPELSRALVTAAGVLTGLGRYAEAEPMLRRALAVADAARPLAPHLQVLALQSLGDFYRRTGRPELAGALLGRALTIAEAMPKGFRYALDVDLDLADLHQDLGQPALARPFAAKAAALAGEILGADAAERARLLLALARIDLALGDPERARTSAVEAAAIYARVLAPGDPRRGDAEAALALVEGARGRHDEAAAGLIAAIEAMAARPASAAELVAARKDAAVELARAGDRSPRAWALARAAADALAARLADQAALPGDTALLTDGERAVFGAAVAVAWANAHPAEKK